MESKDYIGDGVYTVSDGFGIWLYANDIDCPTDKIYLEPQVLIALNSFAERCGIIKENNKNE